MQLPLSFWDFSLWLAVTAIILLATAELISPYYGQMNLIIDRRKLRRAALVLGILFMMAVMIRVYEIVITS